MPFVPASGIVSMQCIWSLDNQNVENTFNYQVAGTIDRAKLHDMAASYAAWVSANASGYPSNSQLLKIYLRDMSTQNGTTLEFIPATTIVGTNATSVLPSNVTLAIKRETGKAGRAMRGRIYLIGISANQRNDDNHISSAVALSFVTQLNTLMATQLSANGATEVIYHRHLGTGTPVVGYVTSDLTFDSQRRRLPDHNRHH